MPSSGSRLGYLGEHKKVVIDNVCSGPASAPVLSGGVPSGFRIRAHPFLDIY